MVKNFTLLSLGILLAGGVAFSANPATSLSPEKKLHTRVLEAQKNHELKGKKDHIATRAVTVTDIIYNPEGESVLYYKDATGMDYYGYYESEGLAAEVVFGDNNDVYFNDILAGWGMPSYVKGVLQDGKITMSLPQTVDDYGWYAINLCVLKQVDDEEYEYDPSISSVEFSYDAANRSMELNLPGDPGQYLLGYIYTDDESWTNYGDFTQKYTVFDQEITSLPEGLETEVYMLNDGYFGHPVKVALTDSKLYMEGFSTSLPNGVIYADVKGDVASIPQDQIIGALYGYFIYTKVLVMNKGNQFQLAPANAVYSLKIDAANKTITSADPDDILCLNGSLTDILYLDVFQDFSLKVQDSFAGTPENPYGLLLDDSYLDYGINIFVFTIPNFSTDGLVLHNEDLYYRVYVDDDLFEFEYDPYYYEYPDVEGVMSDVPFNFDNGMDIYWSTEAERVVYLYFEGMTTLGVQSVYKYDGKETSSDIVTLNVFTGDVTEQPAGVDSLVSAPVVGETYYDLSGRKVSDPANGIFVKRSILSDGKVVTRKVIKR